jgi:hypothetical protein
MVPARAAGLFFGRGEKKILPGAGIHILPETGCSSSGSSDQWTEMDCHSRRVLFSMAGVIILHRW